MVLKENMNITANLSKLLDEHRLESEQEYVVSNGKEYFSFALYNDEELVGGLTAKLKLGQFHIQLLAISKEYRKQGLGKQLMLIAEEKAKSMNAHHLLLTTYSYQGLHFYPKMGFEEMGRISDFPTQGVDKVYFIKYLKKKVKFKV